MEVILREDIDNLGTRGQVVKVAPGYARNFLLPKRLAVQATESNKKIVEQERQAHLRKEAKAIGEAQAGAVSGPVKFCAIKSEGICKMHCVHMIQGATSRAKISRVPTI